ncbi:MAG: hypothetical protein JSR93_06475 [Verrucomicrobia bacterium]|nr:hypothetical protein [Verrucomicrobiota bacterium]
MASTIYSDQIRGLKIYDSESQALKLCRPHQAILKDEIATDVNALVRSRFFQDKFRTLYPADRTGAHFNIRLTDHSLIVQLMREDGRRLNPEGEALTVDLTPTDSQDIIEINQSIIEKADDVYQECQSEHGRSRDTHSTHTIRNRDVRDLRHIPSEDIYDELDSRRSYRRPDLSRISSNDLLDELDARRRDLDDRRIYRRPDSSYDLEPSSRRSRTDAPRRQERSTQREEESPSDALRRARELQLDLQLQASRLSGRSDTTIDQLAPLHEQISRLEQQIQRLSEQLGTTPLTVTASTEASPVLERISDRLVRIEERLNRLENPGSASTTVAASTERPDTTDLTRQIATLTERNEALASQLATLSTPSPTLPHLNDDQFGSLTQLAQEFDAEPVRENEDFPFGKDTQFMDLPEPVRDSIYFQMYTLCNPTRVPDIWRCGEKFFLNQEGLHSNNHLRSLAINRYLLQSLANEFAILGKAQSPSHKVLARFNQLPEVDRIGVLRQFQFLRKNSHEELNTTLDSFLGRGSAPASNEERNESISRYLQAQITDRYGTALSSITEELEELSIELEQTKEQMAAERDQHRLDMERLRLELERLRNPSHQEIH